MKKIEPINYTNSVKSQERRDLMEKKFKKSIKCKIPNSKKEDFLDVLKKKIYEEEEKDRE